MPRPPKRRLVEQLPAATYFKPAGIRMVDLDEVQLSIDELEAIRLKDREGFDHVTCAERMNVSRPTFHRILRMGHQKVADALTTGKAIRIEGGIYQLKDQHQCRQCGHTWKIKGDAPQEDVCPACQAPEVIRGLTSAPRRRRRRRGHGR